ncbi:GDSL-type esterase/lipase family protein [Novipirellula caenicola]|uniref:SGNH hydrolase-type esterase domain-containing protein n=1 Tax=Novipirellula caenicola TaxID=1536901 RepID=A0ABP9VW51_9BACT
MRHFLTPVVFCVVFSAFHDAMAQDAAATADTPKAAAIVEDASAASDATRDTELAPPSDEVPITAAEHAAIIKRWQRDIVSLEKENESLQPNQDAVLFIGSSSIRRWDTIATDMAPFRCIERGYGGAKFSDVAVFAKRLIEPHQYRAMVMFVANDVSGRSNDHPLDKIEAWVRYIIGVSRSHQPDAAVLLIEITPCESRFASWDKIRAVNALLKEIALTTPDTYFIPTAEHYLTADDSPRPELFVADKLHLSPEGYQLWGSIIRQRLSDVLRQRTAADAAADSETSTAR